MAVYFCVIFIILPTAWRRQKLIIQFYLLAFQLKKRDHMLYEHTLFYEPN